MTSRVASMFWSLLLLAVGGRGVVWVYGDTRSIVESAHWVAGTAVVRSARLEESRRLGGARYSPRIEYEYAVDGRSYVGSRFEIPPRRSSSKPYELQRIAPFSPGASIPILYDASDPAESVVLRPEMNWFFTLGLGGLSVALIAAGALILRSAVKNTGRTPA